MAAAWPAALRGGEWDAVRDAIGALLSHELKLANILPPLFICLVIAIIWPSYTCLHLMPMLQVGVPTSMKDLAMAERGMSQMVVVQVLFWLFFTCYTRAILTSPGTIPEPEELGGAQKNSEHAPESEEAAEQRRCKWCKKYKPERCHHCRVCRGCILRMDHHCPWIINCVGWGNHKYFILVVIYSAAVCSYISWTVLESVHASVEKDMPHINRFLLVLCFVLSGFFALLMSSFLLFHIYLISNGMTTIEFCERRNIKRTGGSPPPSYDRGVYNNFVSVFGPRPLLWLLPVDPARGDGVYFGWTEDMGPEGRKFASRLVSRSSWAAPS